MTTTTIDRAAVILLTICPGLCGQDTPGKTPPQLLAELLGSSKSAGRTENDKARAAHMRDAGLSSRAACPRPSRS